MLLAAAPVAAADESAADCEPDQPYIGYAATDPARAIVQDATAGMLEISACEGEHWDGQDALDEEPVFSFGMGEDPNKAPSWDLSAPPGLRVTSANGQEAYAAANVGFVARASLYVGTCGSADPGLEGASGCGGTREFRTGVYWRDNTPGNIVAILLFCSLTLTCLVSEGDCSHDTYVHGKYDPPADCARDNTAFGAGLVLP